MLRKIFPAEPNFFSLFNELADQIGAASGVYRQLLTHPEKAVELIPRIQEIEGKADSIVHKAMEQLHDAFITPIDRQHIHKLLLDLDDVVDGFEAISRRFQIYRVKSLPHEMTNLSELCLAACDNVITLTKSLNNLKKPEFLKEVCVTINRLENEADESLRKGLEVLFRDEDNCKILIQNKELYELLESITDKCEQIAYLVQSIILDYA